MTRRSSLLLVVLELAILLQVSVAQLAEDSLQIPRVSTSPTLEDFLGMKPSARVRGQLAKVDSFRQTQPTDGAPATQKTEVYLGYDRRNLYVVFVAFDSEPEKVRGTLSQRENIDDADDWVEVALDTFSDQRRAYLFDSNPLGVQWDALHSEISGENSSFDTLWHSRGRITQLGFVVWMAIPFKSLRFPDAPEQKWRVQFRRWQSRIPELSAWPHISSRIQGRLNQAKEAGGLRDISPGRNIQLIPYGTFRSFRALDTREPDFPRFRQVDGEIDGGVDAKWVIRDNLVLDGTVNPDFNQVESDQPQVTTNQRFEVFFPEKRPFFQENATYFDTPLNLVFTRRIADPQLGARLTGKTGPWAIGAMVIDDQAPGKIVPTGDPLEGKRALFGIFRVNRDLFGQSSIGVIYTGREFQGAHNRVGGVDARFKLGKNWSTSFQAVTSQTRFQDGQETAGPAYQARVDRNGRSFNLYFAYNDIGEDFLTQTGFIRRTGYRELDYAAHYRFRPEGKLLIAWGPDFNGNRLYSRDGRRLDWTVRPNLVFELRGQTKAEFFWLSRGERLRPEDAPSLTRSLDFEPHGWGVRASTSVLKKAIFSATMTRESVVNFVPPEGREPSLADRTGASLRVLLRPLTPLRIENTYLLSNLRQHRASAGIFTNHIVRSNWNWQFNRELSLRFIAQYDGLLTNPAGTRLETSKNLNFDFLFTYLLNPGTALFIGYNSNRQNIELLPGEERVEIIRNRDRFINDGRQFFVKFSYLLRF